MNHVPRFLHALKALRELGPTQLGLFGLYQFGLRTGHYHRQLAASLSRQESINRIQHYELLPCLPGTPDRGIMLELLGNSVNLIYRNADEIVDGKVRLFGGSPVPLILRPPGLLKDWTEYEGEANRLDGQDIKFIWEPGRFGWACTLAMAYHLTGDERYAKTFWTNTSLFLTSNPPYLGPHWSSAQEAAIRLVSLAFAIQVFIHSNETSPQRLEILSRAIVTHAERIPPTLAYARSQNNNHLITEALGLYTASALLPEHPLAARWHKLGWNWLLYAFSTQIEPDGTYAQHSTNYHRLMLQAALWAYSVHQQSFVEEPIPIEISKRLEASTRWLWKLIDPATGSAPNLGHNDGSYILPLTACSFHDYRPVIYAAAKVFLQTSLKPTGPWNDMSNWLFSPQEPVLKEAGLEFLRTDREPMSNPTQPPYILRNAKNDSWAYLRVVKYRSRPAHADQLHLDLWWRGLNLAQDPGTYLYNAPSPWENSLTSTLVHNTLAVDGHESMLRSSRFLYLDWAQAKVIVGQPTHSESSPSLTTQHDGYRKIGVLHTRSVIACADGRWEVIDRLQGTAGDVHTARLHWLTPDWEYKINPEAESDNLPYYEIQLHSPYGWISLKLGVFSSFGNKPVILAKNFQIARAGTLVYGSGTVSPITGWTSPLYGDKIPALACILEISQTLPIEIKTEWTLPGES